MKDKNCYLALYLGSTFFLSTGYSTVLRISSKDSWVSMILGILIGFLILFLVKKSKVGTFEHSWIGRFFQICFHSFMFLYSLSLILHFIVTFFLIQTPRAFLLLPLALLLIRISKLHYGTLNSLAKVCIPILLVLYLLIFIGLISHVHVDYILPVFTSSFADIFLSSIVFGIYLSIPYLLLEKHYSFKSYFISSTLVFIVGMFIILVLGTNEYALAYHPLYSLLQEIKVFNFMENLENILSFAFLIPVFFTLFISCVSLKKDFRNAHGFFVFFAFLSIVSIFL